jgi:transcriptional regulator with XRE-family HTH domain
MLANDLSEARMQPAPIKFAENLNRILAARGESAVRKKMSEAAKISQSAITQFLKGRSQPSLKTLVALAQSLDVTLDDLVFAPRAGSAQAIDYGPAVHYMEDKLAELQAAIDSQTRIFGVLTQALSDRLSRTARLLASRDVAKGGIITDRELKVVEPFSVETSIIALTFDDDLTDTGSAGKFFDVVAANIATGHRYRFLMPAHLRNWQPLVDAYFALLKEKIGSNVSIHNCIFRTTDLPVITGCGFYALDQESMRASNAVLLARFQEWLVDGVLGFSIAASPSLQADSLMDPFHVTHGIASFEKLWKRGRPVRPH